MSKYLSYISNTSQICFDEMVEYGIMSKEKQSKYTQVGISGEVEEIKIPHKKKKKRLGIPSQYVDLGLYLSVPLLLAVFVGQYLDNRFQKNGMFTILFLVFGTISVFYNLFKLTKQDEDSSNKGSK